MLEHLIVDRFPEFRRYAQEAGIPTTSLQELRQRGKGAEGGAGGREQEGGSSASKPLNPRDAAMKEFFESVKQIQERVASARRSTEAIEQCTEDLLIATTSKLEQQAQQRLESEAAKTNGVLQEAKMMLEELKNPVEGNASAEKENPLTGSSGAPNSNAAGIDHRDQQRQKEEREKKFKLVNPKIRQNMCNSLAKKLQQEVLAFQHAQSVFTKEMKAKTARQLKITCPEASDADIENMIQAGETRDTQVRKQMAGSHAVLLENLQQVHDKYQAIRRLEKSMTELHQMFIDMAQLIDHQGEILDVIEVNVAKTKDYTAQAERELITARKGQFTAQRRMCCITVVMLVIVAIIIFPILFAPGVGKNSGQACDRCLNDDFCRVGLSCHLTHKLCYDATGPFLCNVNATVADMAVSANCEGICNVRFPPFFCGDACLNEDFPCKWVPNCAMVGPAAGPCTCAPNAMTHISCLRGCEDHDCCIPSRLQCSNCAQCYTMYQCNNADRNGAYVRKYCPVTCGRKGKSQECPTRCGRDELGGKGTGMALKQCWEFIINEGKTCDEMVKQGYDCHCSCGDHYAMHSLTHSFPSASSRTVAKVSFFEGEQYAGNNMGLNVTFAAGVLFRLQTTGVGLSAATGGQTAKLRVLQFATTNMGCQEPVAPFLTGLDDSKTPFVASTFYNAFDNIKIEHCGTYKVCHCNGGCLVASEWVHIGTLRIVPPPGVVLPASGFVRPVPGCASVVDHYQPYLLRSVPTIDERAMNPDEDKEDLSQLKLTFLLRNWKQADFDASWERTVKKYLMFELRSYNSFLDEWIPAEEDIAVAMTGNQWPFWRRERALEGVEETPRASGGFLERVFAALRGETAADAVRRELDEGRAGAAATSSTWSAVEKFVSSTFLAPKVNSDSDPFFAARSPEPEAAVEEDPLRDSGLLFHAPARHLAREQRRKELAEESSDAAEASGGKLSFWYTPWRRFLTRYFFSKHTSQTAAAIAGQKKSLLRLRQAGTSNTNSDNRRRASIISCEDDDSAFHGIMGDPLTSCQFAATMFGLAAVMTGPDAGEYLYAYVRSRCEKCKTQLASRANTIRTDNVRMQAVLYHFASESLVPNFPQHFWSEMTEDTAPQTKPPTAASGDGGEFTNSGLFVALLCVLGIGAMVGLGMMACKRTAQYDDAGVEDPMVAKAKKVGIICCAPVVGIGFLCYKGGLRFRDYIKGPPDSEDEAEGWEPPEGFPPYEGAEVTLKNLTKLEYNGLRGKLIKYVEDKDRWLVDVVVFQNSVEEEHKELSLKADNVKVLRPQHGSYVNRRGRRKGGKAGSGSGDKVAPDDALFEELGELAGDSPEKVALMKAGSVYGSFGVSERPATGPGTRPASSGAGAFNSAHTSTLARKCAQEVDFDTIVAMSKQFHDELELKNAEKQALSKIILDAKKAIQRNEAVMVKRNAQVEKSNSAKRDFEKKWRELENGNNKLRHELQGLLRENEKLALEVETMSEQMKELLSVYAEHKEQLEAISQMTNTYRREIGIEKKHRDEAMSIEPVPGAAFAATSLSVGSLLRYQVGGSAGSSSSVAGSKNIKFKESALRTDLHTPLDVLDNSFDKNKKDKVPFDPRAKKKRPVEGAAELLAPPVADGGGATVGASSSCAASSASSAAGDADVVGCLPEAVVEIDPDTGGVKKRIDDAGGSSAAFQGRGDAGDAKAKTGGKTSKDDVEKENLAGHSAQAPVARADEAAPTTATSRRKKSNKKTAAAAAEEEVIVLPDSSEDERKGAAATTTTKKSGRGGKNGTAAAKGAANSRGGNAKAGGAAARKRKRPADQPEPNAEDTVAPAATGGHGAEADAEGAVHSTVPKKPRKTADRPPREDVVGSRDVDVASANTSAAQEEPQPVPTPRPESGEMKQQQTASATVGAETRPEQHENARACPGAPADPAEEEVEDPLAFEINQDRQAVIQLFKRWGNFTDACVAEWSEGSYETETFAIRHRPTNQIIVAAGMTAKGLSNHAAQPRQHAAASGTGTAGGKKNPAAPGSQAMSQPGSSQAVPPFSQGPGHPLQSQPPQHYPPNASQGHGQPQQVVGATHYSTGASRGAHPHPHQPNKYVKKKTILTLFATAKGWRRMGLAELLVWFIKKTYFEQRRVKKIIIPATQPAVRFWSNKQNAAEAMSFGDTDPVARLNYRRCTLLEMKTHNFEATALKPISTSLLSTRVGFAQLVDEVKYGSDIEVLRDLLRKTSTQDQCGRGPDDQQNLLFDSIQRPDPDSAFAYTELLLTATAKKTSCCSTSTSTATATLSAAGTRGATVSSSSSIAAVPGPGGCSTRSSSKTGTTTSTSSSAATCATRLDTNCNDLNNQTPIYYACNFNDRADVIALLLKYGANANHLDKNGETCLYYACRGANFETVKVICELGACNLLVRNYKERLAFDYAIYSAHTSGAPLSGSNAAFFGCCATGSSGAAGPGPGGAGRQIGSQDPYRVQKTVEACLTSFPWDEERRALWKEKMVERGADDGVRAESDERRVEAPREDKSRRGQQQIPVGAAADGANYTGGNSSTSSSGFGAPTLLPPFLRDRLDTGPLDADGWIARTQQRRAEMKASKSANAADANAPVATLDSETRNGLSASDLKNQGEKKDLLLDPKAGNKNKKQEDLVVHTSVAADASGPAAAAKKAKGQKMMTDKHEKEKQPPAPPRQLSLLLSDPEERGVVWLPFSLQQELSTHLGKALRRVNDEREARALAATNRARSRAGSGDPALKRSQGTGIKGAALFGPKGVAGGVGVGAPPRQFLLGHGGTQIVGGAQPSLSAGAGNPNLPHAYSTQKQQAQLQRGATAAGSIYGTAFQQHLPAGTLMDSRRGMGNQRFHRSANDGTGSSVVSGGGTTSSRGNHRRELKRVHSGASTGTGTQASPVGRAGAGAGAAPSSVGDGASSVGGAPGRKRQKKNPPGHPRETAMGEQEEVAAENAAATSALHADSDIAAANTSATSATSGGAAASVPTSFSSSQQAPPQTIERDGALYHKQQPPPPRPPAFPILNPYAGPLYFFPQAGVLPMPQVELQGAIEKQEKFDKPEE
eukprot:g11482.t1